jgi:hypothetical protein
MTRAEVKQALLKVRGELGPTPSKWPGVKWPLYTGEGCLGQRALGAKHWEVVADAGLSVESYKRVVHAYDNARIGYGLVKDLDNALAVLWGTP